MVHAQIFYRHELRQTTVMVPRCYKEVKGILMLPDFVKLLKQYCPEFLQYGRFSFEFSYEGNGFKLIAEGFRLDAQHTKITLYDAHDESNIRPFHEDVISVPFEATHDVQRAIVAMTQRVLRC